ncbi:MAG: hypothetical protein IJ035_09470 [Oscillospiraceae bacterium]|nr:hypothetical protein [Oscillospiraceae bacterium]
MKVKYIGDYYEVSLIKGKVYDVVAIENGLYRIIDEEGYDEDEEIQGYLYPPEDFEVVE